MFGKRLYAWKTIPMSRLFGGTWVMSLPSTTIRPGRPVEAGDEPQRRRLAAAPTAEQREELALLERDLDPVERDDVAERAVQALELERTPSACTIRTGRPRAATDDSSASIAAHVIAEAR